VVINKKNDDERGDVPAILIDIKDAYLQKYLQVFPALNNLKDQKQNAAALQQIKQSIKTRRWPSSTPPLISEGAVEKSRPTAEERCYFTDIFNVLGVNTSKCNQLIDDYYWKLVSSGLCNKQKILSIGPGDGMELIFLRRLSPNAKIIAVDWEASIESSLLKKIDIEYRCGNIFELIDQIPNDFDSIFSNHFIEHLYQPDDLLQKLFVKLIQGGLLVSALPLDTANGAPFNQEIQRILHQPESLHALDLGFFDPGHPWKTTPLDLSGTLRNAGFSEIFFYQRFSHLTRELALNKKGWACYVRGMEMLYRVTLGFLGKTIRFLFGDKIPGIVIKIFFSIETRLAFGSAKLKNRCAPEILFVAFKTALIKPKSNP